MDEMDEQNINESLFERLKKIRIQQNLDLSEISSKSRIQIKYLEAIESGNIEQIPNVYDKLFFQTYISFLNLDDPDIVYAEFKEIRKQKRTKYTTTIKRIKSVANEPEKINRLNKVYIGLPIVIVVIIITILAMHSTKVDTNDNKNVKELQIREVAKEIESKNKIKNGSLTTVQDSVKHEDIVNVFVNLEALERTWLRLVKDHADTSEYLLATGNKINAQADSTIEFLIGKAHGINFKINGEEVGVLGKPGEVISYMKVTSEGIIAKRTKKIIRNVEGNDTLNTN